MTQKATTTVCRALLYVALLSWQSAAQPNGFYVPPRGATGTGTAMAGDAAHARDARTVFSNPAGMVLLPATTLEVGVDAIKPTVRISNRGSTAQTPGTLGAAAPYAGPDGHAGEITPVPSVFYAHRLTERWHVGLAVTAPFGLSLKYAPDWFGRYDSIKTKLLTADIAPSVAWSVTPSWSVGLGLNAQYAEGELTNALPNTLEPGGPTAATDGLAKLTGDDWAFGFNVGVHYHPSPDTRIGAHYRSRVNHHLRGHLSIEGLPGALALANGRLATETDIAMPAVASIAIAQRLSETLTLLGEVQWFGWSAFRDLKVRFANGAPDAVRPQHFRDTPSVAAGAEWQITRDWTLRSGVRFEKTPTVNTHRNTSLPESDLTWIGFGATYRLSRTLALDGAYLRTIFRKNDIDLVIPAFAGSPAAGSINVRGRTDNSIDTFSLFLRYHL